MAASDKAVIHRKMIAKHEERVRFILTKVNEDTKENIYCQETKSMIRRLHNQEVHTLLFK